MDICGHCGGMDRHLAACQAGRFAQAAEQSCEAVDSVSSSNPSHPDVPSSSVIILTGLAVAFIGMIIVVLVWP